MKHIATQEMFGFPVDFAIESKVEGDTLTLSVECLMPHVEFRGGKMIVWAPPRMEKPVTESELAAMRLAGWLNP